MTQESTEETYIGVLMQASLQGGEAWYNTDEWKSRELLLPPVRGMHEERLRVTDEEVRLLSERALDDISFALCGDDV